MNKALIKEYIDKQPIKIVTNVTTMIDANHIVNNLI